MSLKGGQPERRNPKLGTQISFKPLATQELHCAGQDPKDPSGKEQHSLKSEAEISAAHWC